MNTQEIIEMKKRFKEYCFNQFDREEGEEILSVSLDWKKAWDFFENELTVMSNSVTEDFVHGYDAGRDDESRNALNYLYLDKISGYRETPYDDLQNITNSVNGILDFLTGREPDDLP